MYKLVVLCAFLAASVAEPQLIHAPLAYSATVVAPATTTITRQASSVVHPSPLLYSAPLGYAHFIKKRSANLALSTYIAPATYIAAAPLATTYSAPLVHAAPILPAAHVAPIAYTHLIKKRSAGLAYHSTYITPTTYAATTPLLASTYTSTAPYYSTPLVSTPIAYPYSHFIKKRSAPLSYIAPTSYSSQSRIDFHGAPLVTSYSSYAAPIAYSTPFAVRHINSFV